MKTPKGVWGGGLKTSPEGAQACPGSGAPTGHAVTQHGRRSWAAPQAGTGIWGKEALQLGGGHTEDPGLLPPPGPRSPPREAAVTAGHAHNTV